MIENNEVPEPSAEAMYQHLKKYAAVAMVTLNGDPYGYRSPSNREAAELLATGLGEPEPQGEPSDAQVLEDFLGKLAGDGAYTLNFTSAEALHGQIVSLLRRDIGALRATGVGGERR